MTLYWYDMQREVECMHCFIDYYTVIPNPNGKIVPFVRLSMDLFPHLVSFMYRKGTYYLHLCEKDFIC